MNAPLPEHIRRALDRPMRCASSVLVRRASVCNSFRMAMSNLSKGVICRNLQQESCAAAFNQGIKRKDLSNHRV